MTAPGDPRLVFDTIPEHFDKWRQRYSAELFSYIVEKSGLSAEKRCLEIGPGTGQATDFALNTGCDYTAIELGEHLTEVMRRKYSSFGNFKIINGDFETFPFDKEQFDLVYAGATIQWLNEDVAYSKCFEVLRENGWLAIFLLSGNYQDTNPELYSEIQSVYDNYFVSEQPYRRKFGYLNGTEYGFTFEGKIEFPGRREYNSDDYLEYIKTHSDHITLKQEYRHAFFNGIREAILRHNDKIVFDDRYILYLYKKGS
jgi:SAM-dependent methyltransferase